MLLLHVVMEHVFLCIGLVLGAQRVRLRRRRLTDEHDGKQ
jgi:hypothetical protein